jgi:tRNA A-37 threonylcarbamoyl transferase component Bud32
VAKGYEAYCLADRHFYDAPTRGRRADGDFELARGEVPAGWRRHLRGDWVVYEPLGLRLPPQGWKVHASATVDNAADILQAVWSYCVPRRIAFKFIASVDLLFLRNLKYSSRGSSGKFVTIYPADEAELEVVLNELGSILDGSAGPYILSDLRWAAGPLYVRYGGFVERLCLGDNGALEPGIEDGSGRLVPDRRGPVFRVPSWVSLPACLEPHLEARNATKLEGLPYRIDRALHFSNGGGIYAGVDVRCDERVVLKEARPHAALSLDRADAVTRLRRERDMLARLAGLEGVAALRDYFTVAGHEFLVEDFVEGATLNALIVQRWPLYSREVDEAANAEYTAWALDVCARVERLVAAIHARDVVVGDLHPKNLMVRPDGSIVLIDLEVATRAGENGRPTLADPAFTPPRDRVGVDGDRYALACLRLHLFLPLTTLLVLDRGKAHEIACAIAELFPVPAAFLAAAVGVISGEAKASRRRTTTVSAVPALEADPAAWPQIRGSMAAAILASATPDRDDRLFPGDVAQFTTGALNLAHGAAGVLYALDAVGAGRHPDHEDWLVERATDPAPDARVGFYDGLHGVAYTLDRLGRRGEALRVLDICADRVRRSWDGLGLDLASGLAGIGLNFAHFAEATGDSSFWDTAWQVAGNLADRLGGEDDVGEISGGKQPYAGLLKGSSGAALLFLRLYRHSHDDALLELAATALRQDLRRCVRTDHGTLNVNEGWRTMPYVADGSVGIGFAVDDYLAYRHDDRFVEASALIRPAAAGQYYAQAGLFYGRAGMLLYLSRAHPPSAAWEDPAVATHVRRLGWHALRYEGRLAFPGDQLLRLSMDLATGNAGVLLALGAALHDAPVGLPFLDGFMGEVRPMIRPVEQGVA